MTEQTSTDMTSGDAAQLHAQSIVVNGLAQPGHLEIAYDAMLNGGVTVTNLTVAANENFAEGVRKLEFAVQAMEDHPRSDLLSITRNVDDIRRVHSNGGAGVMIGFQNADPIEDNLDYLSVFYRLGLRVLQLTYQRRNLLGDGNGEPGDAGLSIFGHQVIEECNRLGILIDLSHVGYRSTMEAIDASAQPVVFSHANLHAVNPIPRNKTDDQIKALVARGGVMGITSASRLMLPTGGQEGSDLSDYLDQIDYMVDLCGTDSVGIGLDISESMTQEEFIVRRATFLTKFPELKVGGDFPLENYFTRDLSSAAETPGITQGLAERGYSATDISKIIGGNFMRVFEATLDDPKLRS
jgi:membrane dipeptidase